MRFYQFSMRNYAFTRLICSSALIPGNSGIAQLQPQATPLATNDSGGSRGSTVGGGGESNQIDAKRRWGRVREGVSPSCRWGSGGPPSASGNITSRGTLGQTFWYISLKAMKYLYNISNTLPGWIKVPIRVYTYYMLFLGSGTDLCKKCYTFEVLMRLAI